MYCVPSFIFFCLATFVQTYVYFFCGKREDKYFTLHLEVTKIFTTGAFSQVLKNFCTLFAL